LDFEQKVAANLQEISIKAKLNDDKIAENLRASQEKDPLMIF